MVAAACSLTSRPRDPKSKGSHPTTVGSFDRSRADDFGKDRPATLPSFVRTKLATNVLALARRSCCDGKTMPWAERAEEREVQRSPLLSSRTFQAPPSISFALRNPGAPLASQARAPMERALGHSFSDVRIHADAAATRSAADIGAAAYTIGADIVFSSGRFAPDTSGGRRLLWHELVHVAQQSGGASSSGEPGVRSAIEPGNDLDSKLIRHHSAPYVARQNAPETATVLRAGTVRGSGVQFWPTSVTTTHIGPVSPDSGAATPQKLSVIVGQSMTLNLIAQLVLPLWNTATPFTPAGSATPLVTGDLTADQLARGLLVYNRYYLKVLSQPAPSMTGLATGLRLPLPVDVDANGEGTVNKQLIENLAADFDSALDPLLSQPASAIVATPTADLRRAVTDFLASTPGIDARGIALASRAITNAVDARSFVLEAFDQLATSKFDVALAFMDNLVNSQIAPLASQQDGAAILGGIRTALAAAPATLSAGQQESLTRANRMLGIVTGIVPREAPFAKAALQGADVDFSQYTGGGTIGTWIANACVAAGVPANGDWITGLTTLCDRESAFNANAVNTWDSNATGPTVADGHPRNCSRGLAQVIPGTFAHYHVAGTSMSIYDPVANIASAIRYIRDHYGVSVDGSNLATRVQQADATRPPRGY